LSEQSKPVVLVIDDEPVVNQLICATLQKDYSTLAAFDGTAGLDIACEAHPDCIISDLLMPGLSGEELVAALRARQQFDDVPIILLTGQGDETIRAKLLSSGAQDFISKPFSPVELRARVKNWVTAKRAREVLQEALDSRREDLESLAKEVIVSRHDLQEAVKSMRLARDEAEQASRLKSDFLAMVSHEFRTPLTALQLQLKVLLSLDDPRTDRQSEIMERMSGSLGRLKTLIESLLQYASIESGGLSVNFEEVDAGGICVDALDELQPQADDKGIDLRGAIPPERPDICTDPYLLHLALVNLLANAVKFTEEGYVELRLECVQGFHRFTVVDTGPGIPPDDVGRIFQPFEQLEGTRRKHLPGVGLGLALVQDMVTLLGGRVELDSHVGKGSAFAIILPSQRNGAQ